MLSKRERQILYKALVCHDGPSLRPDWDLEHQKELTAALDKLRAELMEHSSEKEA